MRDILCVELKKAGYETVEAEDGLDALEKIKAHPQVALILCDVNMPKMDGLTLCSKLHQMPALSKIPIFMITTESNMKLFLEGQKVGVKAWLNKPVNPAKLLPAVKKILGET